MSFRATPSPTSSTTPALRWRVVVPLGVALVLAAALRVIGAGNGLPYPLLNPDEGNIVPRAWEIVHGGGLDPGWYDYPSLLMLLLSPSQLLAEAPSYGAARVVAIAVGLLGVAAAWWLGREAYGRRSAVVAALTVAVATTHVAYSRMAVTDVLLATLVTAALALLVSGRLEWGGVAIGLAVSAKYPGIALAAPLVVAAWGQWTRLARSGALAAGTFMLTSPFVVLHAGRAWEDISRVQELARRGWLGLEDDPGFTLAFVLRLWDGVGPIVLFAAVALAIAVWRRTRADTILAAFVGAYWLELVPVEAHFDRYVLPLIPLVGVLAGSVGSLAIGALVVLLVPLVWSARAADELRGRDARLYADDWIAANVSRSSRIVADPSTLPLDGYNVTRLELPGPGRPFDLRRDLSTLSAAPGTWLLVSGAVTDRVAAQPELYPREARFYRELDRLHTAAFEADGDAPGSTGPWVRLYRLP